MHAILRYGFFLLTSCVASKISTAQMGQAPTNSARSQQLRIVSGQIFFPRADSSSITTTLQKQYPNSARETIVLSYHLDHLDESIKKILQRQDRMIQQQGTIIQKQNETINQQDKMLHQQNGILTNLLHLNESMQKMQDQINSLNNPMQSSPHLDFYGPESLINSPTPPNSLQPCPAQENFSVAPLASPSMTSTSSFQYNCLPPLFMRSRQHAGTQTQAIRDRLR